MDAQPNQNPERKFSQKQYDMLKRCSEAEDMTEWNDWRKANHKEDVLLEGAFLGSFHLVRALIGQTQLIDLDTNETIEGEAFLQGANLSEAVLHGADLQHAYLQGASLQWTKLQDAKLMNTHLEHAQANFAHFEGADIAGIDIRNADLRNAHFDGCTSGYAEGHRPIVNRNTDIRGVDLSRVWIDPGTKQLLEYNVRRMNWEEWYKWDDEIMIDSNEGHLDFPKWLFKETVWQAKAVLWPLALILFPVIRKVVWPFQRVTWPARRIAEWFIRYFWNISDYGHSTKQIIRTFFRLAILFGIYYYIGGAIDCYCFENSSPGIVSELFEFNGIALPWWEIPFRSVYFSIVTMTTLGFGDMHANAGNPFAIVGYLLLTIQVLLGYVMLGALVTRFAVLFTAGGPAGKFND